MSIKNIAIVVRRIAACEVIKRDFLVTTLYVNLGGRRYDTACDIVFEQTETYAVLAINILVCLRKLWIII